LLLRADIGSALLEAGDRIRQMLAASGAGADGEEEFQELIERLKALQEPGGAAEKTRPEAAQVTAEKRICPLAPPAVVERPANMARLTLLLEKRAWLRQRVMHAFVGQPRIFRSMLATHVGSSSVWDMATNGVALGWGLLTA